MTLECVGFPLSPTPDANPDYARQLNDAISQLNFDEEEAGSADSVTVTRLAPDTASLLPELQAVNLRNLRANDGRTPRSLTELLEIASSSPQFSEQFTLQQDSNPWDKKVQNIRVRDIAKALSVLKGGASDHQPAYGRVSNRRGSDEIRGHEIVSSVLNIELDEEFVLNAVNYVPTNFEAGQIVLESTRKIREISQMLDFLDFTTPPKPPQNKELVDVQPVKFDPSVNTPAGNSRNTVNHRTRATGNVNNYLSIKEEIKTALLHPVTIISLLLLLAGWIFFWIRSRAE